MAKVRCTILNTIKIVNLITCSHALSSVLLLPRIFTHLRKAKSVVTSECFDKVTIFGVSFNSISLNNNKFFMNIYHREKRSFLHNSVKFEYFENLRKI